ncbi:hypothetical protein B0J18DRAFT_441753 [Chaetomium sp. MPI-SDFR-AT-0129]|nr:hypothetical protein B0J18DRAFT_441753 [Chaetomium sp. MPI-SDFR-AT-0129]
MPPFIELSNLQRAIAAQAMPALEVLADDESRLDRSRNMRFERDDPPPYISSSESESEEALRHPVLARPQKAVLADYAELLSQPLNQEESDYLLLSLNSCRRYDPVTRYRSEARFEHLRLGSFCGSLRWRSPLKESLKLPKKTAEKRRAVIVRRNIRKRWQRLGIWNPEWGIPDRINSQPRDWVDGWKWRWQSDADPPPYDPQHPITRAVRLRENLDFGERPVPPPRSHLSEDASASEAESFITSRPWFLYALESFEFSERKERIPLQPDNRPVFGLDGQVRKWWKERGDWKDDWVIPGEKRLLMVGWKWRHESPSPEPEDLSPLITNEMDFTPSEVDALEAVWTPTPSPPSSPQITPKGGWLFGNPILPQQPDVVPEDDQVELDVHEGGQVQPEDQHMEDAGPDAEPPNPPPRRSGRARNLDQPAEAQVAPQPAQPPLRRSARIAAKAASVVPTAPAAPAATASKRQATRRSTRAVPAAPPPPTRNATAKSSKKGAHPSRKTQNDGVTKLATAKAKKGGRKPSAGTSTAAGKQSTPATKTSGRGRGRKRQ